MALATVWAFVFTYGMLWLIDKVAKVQVDAAQESEGLDQALHGKSADLESI